MRILLVDDEIVSLQGILKGVDWRKCGILETFTATSAREAREIIKTKDIDMMLLDIEMPQENGIELLEWCRQNSYNMPCVFLTCHAEFSYAQEAIRLSCLDYILKPMDYEDVEAVVSRMVDINLNQRKKNRMEYYGQWYYQEQVREVEQKQTNVDSLEAVRNTATYICQHLSEKLSVDELAFRVHLNPDYLNRLFKKQMQTSINKYIINERMKLAKELLEEGNFTANTVALQVGYDNYSNFVNMFKKVYGTLPSQILEEHSHA